MGRPQPEIQFFPPANYNIDFNAVRAMNAAILAMNAERIASAPTALDRTAQNGHTEAVHVLLADGANQTAPILPNQQNPIQHSQRVVLMRHLLNPVNHERRATLSSLAADGQMTENRMIELINTRDDAEHCLDTLISHTDVLSDLVSNQGVSFERLLNLDANNLDTLMLSPLSAEAQEIITDLVESSSSISNSR